VCTRMIVISDGRIMVDSTPAKLKAEYNAGLDEIFRKITGHKGG